MVSFSVLGAQSEQILEQVQPVPGFWEFPAGALRGAWQDSSEQRQAEGEGRRRCSHSTGSEVLAAAVLGLGPQSPRWEKGWGRGEQSWGERAGAQ